MLLLPVAVCPAGSLTEPREYGGYNTYVSNSTHTDSKPPWLENVTPTCPPATLRESLEARTVDELKRYLKILSDGQTKPGRKAELVADVRRYCKGAALRNLWEQLDELEQAAIAEVAHDPDRKYDADLFDAKYGGEPGSFARGSLRSSNSSKPNLLSLFFHGQYLPDDLCEEFKSFVPKPEEAQLQITNRLPVYHEEEGAQQKDHEDATPLEVRIMEPVACHDLRAVLGLIDTGKLAVSDRTHQPSLSTCKAVGRVLLGGDYYYDEVLKATNERPDYEPVDPIRSFAWPLLVQAAGLSDVSGKRLILCQAGRRAMTDPPEKTLKKLWQRWMKTMLLDELRRIDFIKGQTGKGKRGLTAVAGRRLANEAGLKMCPTGQWVKSDELFRHMQAMGETFEVTRDPWRLYITDPNYGSLGYSGYHDFEILQARYALCVLFEYAATLGLIDVAYIEPEYARPDYSSLWGTDDMMFLSRYDGLQYLRLTSLGAYCIGLTNQYTPVEPDSHSVLRILSNLDIIDSDSSLDAGEKFVLGSFSTRLADTNVWQLDQGTLLAASEQGRDINEFRKFLLARSNDSLPDTVEHLLSDTIKRTTQLQDKGKVSMIECADASLAESIANDSHCKKYCMLAGNCYLLFMIGARNSFAKR